ncbi:KH domain-containing protein 5 [Elsinoe australis]|uniref:KH domain-containing protein 5 n=1 Tax=Elsinoe australis TaxID=40998 RepID=A0A4V6DW19_9PEZI|nr:KH domain-containing protein 5 [Elsinoe australis]
MSDGSRKRSRFDQTEPAPADPRRSRFDRRSRSPVAKDTDSSRRSRSPVSRTTESPANGGKKPVPAAAIAAAAAAAKRINEQLEAKKAAGLINPAQAKPPVKSPTPATPSNTGANGLNIDIYEQDGDWIKDIEVNDLRNRYTLTKGATQKMIKDKTGADVTTRGAYYPDKAMATAANPPLYLHITSTSKEGLEAAVKEIDEMMKQDLPNLIDERRLPRRREPDFERDERGRRKWPEERIPISLEPINGFNLRAQVVGSGGSYVKHIQSETGARVQIKGRGSGFYEHDTGVESDEPMYLHVAAPDPAQVERAKELCLDLLGNVKQQYNDFKERAGSRGYGGGGGGRGGHNNGYGRGGYEQDGRGRSDSYGGGGQSAYGGNSQYGGTSQYGGNSQYGGTSQYGGGYGGGYGGAQSPQNPQASGAAMSPTAAAGHDPAQAQAWQDYMNQLSQMYPGHDPYQLYMSMYAQGYQTQGQAGQYPGQQGQGAAQAPPPPPPADDQSAPPPPPPGAGGSGGYNSVPPPPGIH